MVEPQIAEIVDEAIGKWEVLSVVVEHRTSVVVTGEASVAVAVSSSTARMHSRQPGI
jgi:molybdopterin synthase catalytic subunit